MVIEKKDATAEQDALLTYLTGEFNRMDVDYKSRQKGFEALHKQFRGVIDESTEGANKKSRLFINRTKVAVIGGVSNIIDILFPGTDTDFFDVVGRTDADQQSSSIIKKLVQWLVAMGEFHSEAIKYVMQAAVYGTAFGKVTKKRTVEVSVDKYPILGHYVLRPLGIKTFMTSKAVEYPIFESVDIFDMWIDPAASTIENASGLFHRVHRTLGYLREKEREKIYKNIDEVSEQVVSNSKKIKDKRRSALGLNEIEYYPEDVELYEYWGVIPKDVIEKSAWNIQLSKDEEEVECIVTLSNMSTILRAERNTYQGQERLFIKDVWEYTADKSFYGRGICENVRGPQMALNATINMRLDNKAWAIAAPLVINEDNITDEKDLIPRPNWIIRVSGRPEDVAKFAAIPNVSDESYIEAREFERQIEEESGINKTISGPATFGSNRTLGGISLAFSAASKPLRLVAREFERNLIAKTLRKLYSCFLVKLDKEMVIRVVDDPSAPQFLNIDPLSLSLDIDFIPSGTFALTSRETTVQNLVQFAQAVSQIPGIAQQLNWEYLIKKFYEGLGFRDFDKVWTAQPMMGGNVENILAALGGGPGAGAGGTPTAEGMAPSAPAEMPGMGQT